MTRVGRSLRTLTGGLFGCLVGLGVSFALSVGLLALGKFLWLTYIETPIGAEFIEAFGSRAQAVMRLFGRSLVRLSLEINLLVLAAGILVGTIAHITYLQALYYDSRGFLGRLFFWLLPFSCLITYRVEQRYGLPWFESFLLSFLPSVMLFPCASKLTAHLLPDGALIAGLYRALAGLLRSRD